MIPLGARGWRKCFVINGVCYRVEKCRHCFADICFTPTARGKRRPTDSDGGNHFVTCPVLSTRRKRRKQRYEPPDQLKLF